MTSDPSSRKVLYDGLEISYQLERKQVKNLNLRIRKDGSVYVSANAQVPESKVDEFVKSKGSYVLSSLRRFRELAQYQPQNKQYVSGETFCVLGRGLRLKVSEAAKNAVYSDGVYIFLQVKDSTDFMKKKRMVTGYLDKQCRDEFENVIAEVYPRFQKYGVPLPTLRIRDMETRWGSCLAKKEIITLNKRLLAVPRSCIEYVVMHELSHFIHPNHSKQFYGFLTMMMPDWRARKTELDKYAEHWL